MITNNTIDWDHEWNYPLQWLRESEYARWEYQGWVYRMNQAMLGKPSRNLYKDEVQSNLQNIPDDILSGKERERCLNVPEGQSFIISRAVSNRANQMAGGVDSYEYQINDPYMLVNDDTEELLAAKCEQDYVENELELFAPTFSRDLDTAGLIAVLVKYDEKRDKNDVYRINPKNVWFDTMYSATGSERFRGYSTMISWKELKKIIERDNDEINNTLEAPKNSVYGKDNKLNKAATISSKKIKTINDLDIYVEDMNKLAASPSLEGVPKEYFEYSHDLRSCYNLNWYQSLATDPKAKTNSGYNGDDVELTVIYDLSRMIEFKIINRRYVISANHRAFRRKIKFPVVNSITNETRYRLDDFYLECPLKFRFEEQENRDKFPYPTAQSWKLLDSFDQLCAWRSKRDHVSKLLSILRIEANGGDADSLRKAINIMGIVLDEVQGDISTVNFQYDYSPIDSQIQYLENMIMADMHAYDQFDALQTMGDRASAAESGMAIGAIAQGLATHQNAIMSLYADVARQCIANRVAYSPMQEFAVSNYGNSATITAQQMALNAIVRVKPKLAKRVQERTLAANALSLLGVLKDVANDEVVAYLMSQALMGQMPRKLAAHALKAQGATAQEVANATLQAQNQAQMLQQNQAAYEQNPIPYEVDNVMSNYSPDEVDAIISELNTSNGGAPAFDTEVLDMQSQDVAMASDLPGQTPESGSALANQNSFAEM